MVMSYSVVCGMPKIPCSRALGFIGRGRIGVDYQKPSFGLFCHFLQE